MSMTVRMAAYGLGIAEVRFKQDPVTAQKLVEGVAHGIAGFPDPDRLHHSRIAELTKAQLPVEQLRRRRTKSDELAASRQTLRI